MRAFNCLHFESLLGLWSVVSAFTNGICIKKENFVFVGIITMEFVSFPIQLCSICFWPLNVVNFTLPESSHIYEFDPCSPSFCLLIFGYCCRSVFWIMFWMFDLIFNLLYGSLVNFLFSGLCIQNSGHRVGPSPDNLTLFAKPCFWQCFSLLVIWCYGILVLSPVFFIQVNSIHLTYWLTVLRSLWGFLGWLCLHASGFSKPKLCIANTRQKRLSKNSSESATFMYLHRVSQPRSSSGNSKTIKIQ